MLADVLVLTSVRHRASSRSVFSYAVPASLAPRLAPGQLVTVPFGSRLAPGIIWGLRAPADDESSEQASGPPDETAGPLRDVVALLDPIPFLSPQRRALAEWLADRYACSLATAAHLMLPPGLLHRTRVVLRPIEPDAVPGADDTADVVTGETDHAESDDRRHADVTRDEAAVLGALRARGQLDERALRATLGARRAQATLAALLSSGAAARETIAPSALTAARRETRVRLVGTDAALATWRTAARAELDTLPSPQRARGRSPLRGERRAERLLRQLAVLDVLGRPPGGSSPLGAPSAWRLQELLRLTRATPSALAELERAGLVARETTEVWYDPMAGRAIPRSRPFPLTSEQAAALAAILTPQTAEAPEVALLHGITGSGKTEIYLQALAVHLAEGRRGIVLVPEIALTPQAMVRFAGRFPGRVALLHSGLTDAERLDEWRRIRAGLVDVVVGSRSALFAPVDRLGLIVVDEEHEAAYKQEGRGPTYHARDVAVELGRLSGATVVLGSATPSVESFWHASRGDYRLVELAARAPSGGAGRPSSLPTVQIVDLRAELRAGNTSILGTALQVALKETLASGQQAILFLNRRGMASSVLCRECGFVARCARCDVPLTYHASEDALICHYCGQRQAAPQVCPHCWGASLRYFGLGTERVEAAVRRLLPQARVLRWDRDTARTRRAHEELLAAFSNRHADVMVGTQMIAKGLDLPGVTLVGVVSADVALYLPDFRASERAFQLLTQVAGRAGRGETPGRVIVQTFNPDHFCIQAAARHEYHAFYAAEVSARQRYGYPPFRQFVKFTFTHADRHLAQIEATVLADRLQRLIAEHELHATDLVGPAPAFMERLRGHYRWHVIARGPDLRALLHALAPEDLPRGWAVDVDPASTL
ncbi:MAG TPA: primosomal protein N' [Ktedonobacterales bacterium]